MTFKQGWNNILKCIKQAWLSTTGTNIASTCNKCIYFVCLLWWQSQGNSHQGEIKWVQKIMKNKHAEDIWKESSTMTTNKFITNYLHYVYKVKIFWICSWFFWKTFPWFKRNNKNLYMYILWLTHLNILTYNRSTDPPISRWSFLYY